ncbi:MAG: ADP-ribosylglycohydrolase family protein [Acholeplasmataceae bacterium]
MIGAIIGDIIGSRFEFANHRNKDFALFSESSTFTDDTVMTVAVAKAILETEAVYGYFRRGVSFDEEGIRFLKDRTIECMRLLGRRYPDRGYGGLFKNWLEDESMGPYQSYGNGAAMRISPVGTIARSEAEAIRLARAVTSVTHDHEEGIKGAEATAIATYMARQGRSMDEIRARIERDYYDLSFTIDGIRPTYEFNETCQETVPQAIECFLESTSFEDAIRLSVSLGGDTDTIAAIVGGIAAMRYPIPKRLKQRAMTYLDQDLKAIVSAFDRLLHLQTEAFESSIKNKEAKEESV